MKGRALLCLYEFFFSGRPQSLRWSESLRLLSQRGWEIDVLTIEPAEGHPQYNAEIKPFVPANVRVFKTYPGLIHSLRFARPLIGNSPLSRAKVLLSDLLNAFYRTPWYNRTLRQILVPDDAVEWLPFALKAGRRIVEKSDVIISCAPPFTSHVVGYLLKRLSKKPWIAYYDDPWTIGPWMFWVKGLRPVRRHLDRKLEEKLLRSTDKIIVVTEETKEAYLAHFPFLRPENLAVISYGFNAEEFRRVKARGSSKFRIVYTGFFYERDAHGFFRALKGLKDLPLEVIIVGNIDPAVSQYLRYVEREELSPMVTFLGGQPHNAVISLQKGATVLLSFGWPGGLQIPCKIFEYIGAKRPVLAIRYDDKDAAAKLIMKLNRGIVVDNEPIKIEQAIRQLYKLWRTNTLVKRFNLEPVEQFSWAKLGEKLEETILDTLGKS